jgi:uroporphyrinogen decarboxylase-like protein
MNRRERFLETMTYGSPDRPASADYFSYDSTRERWEREGLPKGVDLDEYFDMDFTPFRWKIPHPAVFAPIPDFGTTILEEDHEYQTVRRPGGETVKIFRNIPPPSMPHWIHYPLQSRQDWQKYRKRLDPDTPERLPQDFAELAEAYCQRDYPLGMWLGGTYGYMRNWWGVEKVSVLFYDSPAVIEEMIECLTHLALGLLARVLTAGVQLDWVMFWEDMAFKTGPLISPAMFKRYCIPFYEKVMERVRAAGIPVVMVDSDGDVRELIPLWLDVGVNIMHPMEVAAGMDVEETRTQYGKRVGFFGGIDKRALAGTREQIRAEVVPKLEVGFSEGGFIPACDHAIPPDVSFDNYRYYRELVREVSARLYP